MKKGIAMFMALTVAAGLLVGCGSNSNSGSGEGSNSSSTAAEAASTPEATPEATTEAKSESKGTDSTAAAEGPINVVSREDGSGTRGAFIELFGIEEKNDAGEKVDMTTEAAPSPEPSACEGRTGLRYGVSTPLTKSWISPLMRREKS